MTLVASVRASLCESHGRVKETSEVYLLPPASHVKAMTLGYHAAAADVLWAHTLVAQGLRLKERRRFENIGLLYDAINELDPTWRAPYRLADALITLQSAAVGFDEAAATRRILERGVANRPLDAELWLNLGQFVSFIAPSSYLDEHPELIEPWRHDGLRYLERAAELGAQSQVGWQTLGGATLLAREGKRDAAIRFYERQYAVTDDPELRETIERHLKRLLGEEHRAHIVERRRAFDALLEAEFPWLADEPVLFLLLGPKPRAECVGLESTDADCATTWRDWAERQGALR